MAIKEQTFPNCSYPECTVFIFKQSTDTTGNNGINFRYRKELITFFNMKAFAAANPGKSQGWFRNYICAVSCKEFWNVKLSVLVGDGFITETKVNDFFFSVGVYGECKFYFGKISKIEKFGFIILKPYEWFVAAYKNLLIVKTADGLPLKVTVFF